MNDLPANHNRLGEHLKRLRRAAGLSGHQVPGVNQSTISRIENGRIRPSHPLLIRMLDGYEVDRKGREQAYLLWDQAALPPETRRRQVEGARAAWEDVDLAPVPSLLAGATAAEEAALYLTRAQLPSIGPERQIALLDEAEGCLVQVLAALHAARTQLRSSSGALGTQSEDDRLV